MRILFVYGNTYSLGGIQTWLLRYARRLSSMGHEVHLLTRPPAPPTDTTTSIVDEFARHGTVHVADDRYQTADASLGAAALPSCDAIVCCNLESLLLGAVVQERMPAARLVVGVFHPREYCWRSRWWKRRWDQRLVGRLLGAVPIENVFVSTDGMARQTGACLGRDLSRAAVIPLAIEVPESAGPSPDRAGPLRVVSVARLVEQYPHHGQLIDVVRAMRAEGLEVEYHAYGDGPMRAELELAARQAGGGVTLHGTLAYERFAEAVGGAFAYVGHGTALIEAAALGVPALVGIDAHPEPMTYGFLGETTGNDIGGRVPGHPEFQIAGKLRWLAGLDDGAYAEVARACYERAREFDIATLAPRLVQVLHDARPFEFPISPTDRAVGRADRLLYRALLRARLADPPSRRYLPHGDQSR